MKSIDIYLVISSGNIQLADAVGRLTNDKPALYRGQRTELHLHPLNSDGTNYTASDLAEITQWEFVIDNDWITSDTPMIRVISNITVTEDANGAIIAVPLDSTNTQELIDALGNNASVTVGAELTGFTEGVISPDLIYQFSIQVNNRRSDAGTGTPTEVPDGQYNAIQIDSMLGFKSDTSHNHDGTYSLTGHDHDSSYAGMEHSHEIEDVTNLQNSLDAKASLNYVDTKVADLVASSPETLDTLNELADALGNDPDFATTVATSLGNKADINHHHDASYSLTGHTHSFQGITAEIDTGVAVGDSVFIADNTGTLTCYKSDNTTSFADGVVAAVDGTTATIVKFASLSIASGFANNAALFLGTNGALADTPPTANGSIVQVIGRAVNANTILVNLGQGRVIV